MRGGRKEEPASRDRVDKEERAAERLGKTNSK